MSGPLSFYRWLNLMQKQGYMRRQVAALFCLFFGQFEEILEKSGPARGNPA
jgi:hypothetical protein